MNPAKLSVAAFDFDGTLTFHDVLIPFFCFAFGRLKTYAALLKISPRLIGFPLGLQTRQDAKETILQAFLKDMPSDDLQRIAKEFALGPLRQLIKPAALKRFYWHKKQGHTCVVISANLECIIRPWAEQAGFDHVIASQLQLVNGVYISGLLQGKNCWGKEKVNRLVSLLGNKDRYCLYAYGDSRGDKELLDYADHPGYCVF